MSEKIITNRSSAVIVQLDPNRNGDLCGRIYSRFYGSGTGFNGIHEFLNACEDLFDTLACPQAAVTERTFREKSAAPMNTKTVEVVEDMDQIIQSKGKNTFVINVLFRQNASWQGTIQWVNQNKTQHFRSTLELIKLMDSALESEEEAVTVGWESNE